MNPNIEALRAELKARFDTASKLLDQVESIITAPLAAASFEAPPEGTAKRAPSPQPSPPVGERVPEGRVRGKARNISHSASPPTGRRSAGVGNTEQRVREVIATLAEPFNTRDVADALAKADPEFAKQVCDGYLLGYTVMKLRKAGQLIGEGSGKGMKYSRSKKFTLEPLLSEKEAAYRKLRAEIKTPAED